MFGMFDKFQKSSKILMKSKSIIDEIFCAINDFYALTDEKISMKVAKEDFILSFEEIKNLAINCDFMLNELKNLSSKLKETGTKLKYMSLYNEPMDSSEVLEMSESLSQLPFLEGVLNHTLEENKKIVADMLKELPEEGVELLVKNIEKEGIPSQINLMHDILKKMKEEDDEENDEN